MNFLKFYFPLICFCLLGWNMLSAKPIPRGAIDFGSGALKIQVALVDDKENKIIGEPLYISYVPINLTEDIAANNGAISFKMEQQAFEILRKFKSHALGAAFEHGYSSVQFAGVATAAFRKATNGPEVLKKFSNELNIRLQILSQEDEGRLGFMTAKALFPKIPESNLLVWDSGNGSFQLTSKDNNALKVYQGPLGHGTVRLLLAKDVRNGPPLKASESGNPISIQESEKIAEKLNPLFGDTPEWLANKIADEKTTVVTYGDGEAIFFLTTQALGFTEGNKDRLNMKEATLTLPQARSLAFMFIDQDDQFLKSNGLHFKTVTAVLLVKTVMDHFGINQIQYARTLGNTSGMLISQQFWK